MPATIVDIHCRVAPNDSDIRTELSQQEADCRAYCEQHGLIVSLVHTDIATGMTYRDRGQLTNLRRRYRAYSGRRHHDPRLFGSFSRPPCYPTARND